MARRQHLAPEADTRLPCYEWAFDEQGRPVAIERAERGRTYFCPLCGGKMISRLGEIKQYHYAHELETDCPPEAVARVAAARWIALRLQDCLAHRQAVRITWPCRLCNQPHSSDLLAGVAEIREGRTWQGWTADLTLLDTAHQPRAVIALGPSEPGALRAYATSAIAALNVTPERLRGQPFSLPHLLTGATIYGGVCPTQQRLGQQGIAADVPTLRALLAAAALREPYYAYGSVEDQGSVQHMLTLGERALWLPPALWQRAVGGLLHTISPALQVVTQEWPQSGGSIVALYYVTVKGPSREASAVAVRRFAPGEPVQANLASVSLRVPEVAAIQIARGFARG